jgi:hypothetical protein
MTTSSPACGTLAPDIPQSGVGPGDYSAPIRRRRQQILALCPALTKPRGFPVPNVSGNGLLGRHIPVLRLPPLSKHTSELCYRKDERTDSIWDTRGGETVDMTGIFVLASSRYGLFLFNEERTAVELGEAIAR